MHMFGMIKYIQHEQGNYLGYRNWVQKIKNADCILGKIMITTSESYHVPLQQ